MTTAPAWPPPVGTAIRFEAECRHGSWVIGRHVWDGKPRSFTITPRCPIDCEPTIVARWTETT